MERSNQLKRERTQLRRSFTKICHDLDSLLKDKLSIKEDVMSCLNQLEDKSDRLHILDEQIREKLLADDVGDEEFEAEWNSVESFREESIKYKTRCTSYLNEATKREEIVSNANSTSLGVGRRNFKLPKLELKRFDGEVKNWIGFWGQFRKIHEDSTIDKEDKFQYLIQSTEQGSTARELVESFPPSGDNYEKAVEQLKTRFARDEFLIEVYVRELLNLVLKQSMTNKAGMSLSNLFDKLETQLRALETLGVTSDKYAAMLYPLAESALPEDILKVWERYRSSIVRDHPGESSQNSITNNISGENVHKNPTNHLNLLLDFLKAEVESEERIKLARTSFSQGKESGKSHNYQKVKPHLSNIPELNTAATIFTSEKKKGKKVMNCIFCDRSHSSQDCLSANKLTFDEKKDMVIKKNCCFGCLKPNHNVRFCKYFIKCLLCGKKHFTLMCPDLPSNKSVNDNVNGSQKEQLGDTENVLTSLNSCTETLLQTVIVRLVKDGKSLLVRALLDSASQRSYILSSYAKQMNFIKVREETIIQGVFGGSETQAHAHSLFDVSIESLDKSFQLKFVALDQTRICNHIPRLHNKKYIDYLKRKNIIISDSDSKLTEIVILLGADVIGNLFTGIIEKVDEDLFAIETRLGWTLMGKQQKISDSFPISSLCSFQIPDLWSLEVLGIRDSSEIKTKEHLETETIQNFNETIILTDENRYQVSLPWVKGHPKLLNNFDIAEKRLFNVTKKLRDNNRYSEYEQVFQEWEKLDIIERVPENEMEKSVYYLPHHAVIKDSSATTKIRPVFDASAKDKKDHSLNDCLEKGPNLIELIPKILLQFRLGAIGVIADIKKAFLQISLKEEDRDFLRFLWWEDQKNNKKVTFRHRRVVFGVSSSPFLLAATINYHLERVPDNLKETARKLKNSFYVDNCVASVENMSDLLRFKEESTRIMSSARFELRGWIHSFGNSNDDITCKENVCSVLGLSWNFKNDTIFCDTNSLTEVNDIPRTKRGLLSISQRIFDPIGFTCPVTLTPKLLLQKTWQLKLGWDKKLPENIVKDFENWLKQIPWLTFCIVPRHICDCPLNDTINTLHVFCDSSKTAYATCIFLRSEKNGVVSLKLIQAKARIAPIKPITLPRLELLAAVIGVRLCQSVKKVEIFSSMKAYYWSDSMVVLSWIKSKEDWNTFVGNRVKEICSVSDPVDWFHVPGIMNIADLPSRGCSAKNLAETKWWNGPEWLRKNSEFWPKSEISCSEEELLSERRKSITSSVVHETEKFTKHFDYFSKYSKIVRMITWIFRFYFNVKDKNERNSGELTCEEVEKSETCLLRMIQHESFGKMNTDVVQNLEVMKDGNGMLRVKTKLLLSEDNEDFKYPILLPHHHNIVHRLIFEQHCLSCHAGLKTLLAILRERFWILKARRTIKQVISKCIVCKRYNQKSVETPFAPLPANRINNAATFEVSGMDYAGPLFLKGGEKAWFLLFTCAVYRAIHFELVTSLSTESFLRALRRFIARRGRVSTIYSDNGTSFVGANNLLKRIDWEEIMKFSSVKRIRWIFNVPTAAWWGGWWERLVRITKELLRRNLGKASVTYEELMTLLCDCEMIINSRPLTYISNDDELIPLSPLQFLQSIPTSEVPDLDTIDREYLLGRQRYLQNVRDNLRGRFRKEYLAELVHHGHRKVVSIQPGDIVLVEVDNKKRVNWPLAKVLEIFPGKDNLSRVAKVKLSGGELFRPFQRLFPLEIPAPNNEEIRGTVIHQKKIDKKLKFDSKLKEEIDQEPNPDPEYTASKLEKQIVTTRCGRLVKVPKRFGV